MSSRIWFRSLYWRIALGFVALLAAVLLAQTVLFLWLTDRFSRNSVSQRRRSSPRPSRRTWPRSSRTIPRSTSSRICDRTTAVRISRSWSCSARRPRTDRTGRRAPLRRAARSWTRQASPAAGTDRNRARTGGRRSAAGPLEEFAPTSSSTAPSSASWPCRAMPPPVFVGLWELAPTLTWVGLGTARDRRGRRRRCSIFRPTHKRLRTLEEAARALGEGRTDVRANETGGDEVSALARDVQPDGRRSRRAARRRSPRPTARAGSSSPTSRTS